MASLLYPDEEQAQIQAPQGGPLSLLQPPDDRPPILQPDPRADALGTVYQQVMDAMEAQRRISAERGLWDDNTGMPTKAGLLDAIGQAGTAVALGTSAPGDAPPPGFTAYHGSPHQFDAFDLSKIGTGEGNQAYGHGMYLADKEGVARGYRDQLSGNPGILVNGTPAGQAGLSPGAMQMAQMHLDGTFSLDALRASNEALLAKAQRLSERFPDNPITRANADMAQRSLSALDELKGKDIRFQSPGHMYEVQVNADPAHFLDWDRPLSEQHPKVQSALADLGFKPNPPGQAAGAVPRRGPIVLPEPTGAQIYARLGGGDFGGKQQAASDVLHAAGIPGIRYLDQGSRGAGEGTRNSVVFSPEIMEIIRRYGLAGLMAGGGAAAMGGQQRQQQ